MNIRYTVDLDFFNAWNEDMAWVLGYFFADGCLVCYNGKTGRKYKGLSFVSADRDLLEHVKALMKYTGPIRKCAKWLKLSIIRQELCKAITRYGITPRKSLTMKFPEIPKEYFWDFVRGYFDGDGCVSINREKYIYIIFSSGSKKFLEGLRDDLVLQGLSYKEVGQQRGRTTHFLNYQRKEDVLTLYKGMYHKDVLPCLSRKRQQFLRFFSSDKSTICPDCGTVLQRTGRCSICMACGWSVCEF